MSQKIKVTVEGLEDLMERVQRYSLDDTHLASSGFRAIFATQMMQLTSQGESDIEDIVRALIRCLDSAGTAMVTLESQISALQDQLSQQES